MVDNNSGWSTDIGVTKPSRGGKALGMNNIGTKFLAFSSVVILVIVSYFAFLLLYPLPKIAGSGVVLESTSVQAGSLQRYRISGCINPGSQVDISRSLVNTDEPPTVEVDISYNVQRVFQCENIFLIPAATPTGRYHLTITILQHVNPLRVEPTTLRSQTFTVTNNNPSFQLPASVPTLSPKTRTTRSIVHHEASAVPNTTSPPASKPQGTASGTTTPTPPASPDSNQSFLEQILNPLTSLL